MDGCGARAIRRPTDSPPSDPPSRQPEAGGGPAGNGFAFFSLQQRTVKPEWMDRPRAFAMRGNQQVETARSRWQRGRHCQWTGDLGVALFLWSCARDCSGFPRLDLIGFNQPGSRVFSHPGSASPIQGFGNCDRHVMLSLRLSAGGRRFARRCARNRRDVIFAYFADAHEPGRRWAQCGVSRSPALRTKPRNTQSAPSSVRGTRTLSSAGVALRSRSRPPGHADGLRATLTASGSRCRNWTGHGSTRRAIPCGGYRRKMHETDRRQPRN